ncbi:hypothetical protein AVEN_29891-1 [Araneus ventricosus]|uniref:Uncharacterized protein n=1 Tax=Araneus ventricosus TaxID=182803 RepID=A0A4Y1ZUA6_ARAVE|nr:hypothetical protein AVEN_29891-1 [Araneus ventricosus]
MPSISFRKPVIGLWINFVVMIASVIGVGIQNYIRDFPPTNLFIHGDVEVSWAHGGFSSDALRRHCPPLLWCLLIKSDHDKRIVDL